MSQSETKTMPEAVEYKPRIAWIPSNLFSEKEWQTVNSEGFYELVNVIEYSAYAALKAECERLKTELEKWQFQSNQYNEVRRNLQASNDKNAALAAEIENLKGAVDRRRKYISKLTLENTDFRAALVFYAKEHELFIEQEENTAAKMLSKHDKKEIK
jgi:uncharacterized small protein (DUF1192 family)